MSVRFGVRLAACPMLLLLVAASLPVVAAPAAPAASLAPYDPYILEVLEAEGTVEFYAVLRLQADLSAAYDLPTKAEKGQYVFHALTAVAERTQVPLLASLAAEGIEHRPYWIRNMVKVRGDKAVLDAVAAHPDVAQIVYEYPAYPDVEPVAQKASPDAIEWNILRVNAPDVWALGITGEGAVVGDLDTGVEWYHPALISQYRPWINGAPTRHDYNWYDGPGGSTSPVDYGDHGTHTMGTIVGDDGGDNQIGVAPGADWIACAGLGANASPTDCFQWFLAPTWVDGVTDPRPDLAPDVINNSWSSAGTDYHPIIQVLYAAGIYYAKSAGNEGAGCGTITNPGQWPEVTATAAFANGDVIAGFSSRGPIVLDHEPVIKPDVAAPGVSVRSSLPGATYGLKNGTSMACPHVTGAVALLISAQPELAGQIDILQKLVKYTAEPKYDSQCPPDDPSGRPNNVWGWGILDTLAAVQAAQAAGLGAIEGTVTGGMEAPLADVFLSFVDTDGWPFHAVSAADGTYGRTLPASTYTALAEAYGYLPTEIPGVVVSDGMTTTLDIDMLASPLYIVEGTVSETGSNDPLPATVSFEATPVQVETDPATGYYSASVALGEFWMQVTSPGHAGELRQVLVDHHQVQDFSLPAIYNYYMRSNQAGCGPVYDWIDVTNGNPVYLSDDSYQFVSLPAGRDFTFYGNTYTNAWIGSNGHITFGTPNNKWSGPIPDPATPNNGIYAFSTDLNPASGAQGMIYWEYVGDRYFVVEWFEVEHYPFGSPETFEIILDLDTGQVILQYLQVSDANQVVVGVENIDGTEATQYVWNDPALLFPGLAAQFWPAFGTPPQLPEGVVTGGVTELGAGTPIPGALIEATAGGQTFATLSNDAGGYELLLCEDAYSLQASAAGYLPSDVQDVIITAGETQLLDFALDEPLAGLSLSDDSPTPLGTATTLTATLSAGYSVTYTWGYGDGTAGLATAPDAGSQAVVSHTYPSLGTYYPVVTVTNGIDTLTATTSVSITDAAIIGLSAQNDSPTVLGETTTLTATVSAGSNVLYTWDLGDGSMGEGATLAHTYSAAGTYTAVVTASNSVSWQTATSVVAIEPPTFIVYLPLVSR